MGLGAALRTGYRNSKHPWIITIDCDMSYSPNQIRNLVAHIEDDVDAIFGSPYMKGGKVLGVSSTRLIPSKVVNIIYSLLVGKFLSCWTSIFRIMRRSAIQSIDIKRNGFDAVAEIAIKLARNGYRIVEVPAILGRRKHGESKSQFIRDFLKHLNQLLQISLQEV
jgi:dolichol-phosphate mannosyltransferase